MPIRYICRASYKLANIDYIFKIMKSNENFVDLCGGPGGFSEYILDKYSETGGIGITLRTDNASLDWKIEHFRKNIDRVRFTTTYGKPKMIGPNSDILQEGSGDLTDIDNINFLINHVLKCNTDGVHLVTADGAGFNEEDEQDLESIEIYQFRLFFSEAFTATQILKKGGNFVMKIFKTKYACTQSLLILIGSLFEQCYIFKPCTSRVGNSERYFIGKGFKYSPSDKIHYEFFKFALTLPDIENFMFCSVDSINQKITKYFYDTSLENLQRQYIFCEIYQSGYSYNWKNFISLKKLATLLLS